LLDRGARDLAALASELGLSVRQLEPCFNASVGLPPKLFFRPRRFIHVFHRISAQRGTWVDYDQAHLIATFEVSPVKLPRPCRRRVTDLARHFLQRFGVSHSYNTASDPAL
jgi:hypothetical protein